MRAITAVLVLLSCQQIFAAIPTFEEFRRNGPESAKLKLAEMKAKLARDIEGMPELPEFKLTDEMRAKFDAGEGPAMGKVPDFAARKASLAGLKAKLAGLRAAQTQEVKPNKAFFAEIQKALVESMDMKMVDFKLPASDLKEVRASMKPASDKSTPKVDRKWRNVENFTEEIYNLHEENVDLHRFMLEGTRVARSTMVDTVYEVYQDIMQNLATTTQGLWDQQERIQAAIDFDEAAGAAQGCVDEQKVIFDARNRFYGSEVNRCANFVYNRGRSFLRTIFYPTMEQALGNIGSQQYVILRMMSMMNMARNQEQLIQLLNTEFNSVRDRWTNNWAVVLEWEENRFSDEMIVYRTEMGQCLNYVTEGYAVAAEQILAALYICPVPTKV